MIEDELRALLRRADPVPPQVDEAARIAFTWRTIDAELAELMLDSYESELAVRGGAGPRTLSFEAPQLVIELEVTAGEGRSRDVAGQLLPPGPATVTMEQGPGESVSVEADELGRFSFAGLHAGPARVRVSVAAGEVAIPWTSL